MLDAWSSVLQGSFQDLWLGIAAFLPQLVIAIVIFVVGWAIGSLLGRVVSHIIGALKVDSLLESAHVDNVLKRGLILGGLWAGSWNGSLLSCSLSPPLRCSDSRK